MPWERCGVPSAGNGALMRIAPILIPHLKAPSPELWADAALAAMITHNDAASTAACVAFVAMLWELLAMDAVPNPYWWPRTYVSIARELEGDAKYRPRGGDYLDYEGPIWRFVSEKLLDIHWRKWPSVLDLCNRWHSGAFLLETVPSVLYILMRHANDPEEAIVRAVNDTKDNDTIAAIVGAAVGTLHGKAPLPQRWIENLSGRTTDRDDGRIFELLASARQRWAPTPVDEPGRSPHPSNGGARRVPQGADGTRRVPATIVVPEPSSAVSAPAGFSVPRAVCLDSWRGIRWVDWSSFARRRVSNGTILRASGSWPTAAIGESWRGSRPTIRKWP